MIIRNVGNYSYKWTRRNMQEGLNFQIFYTLHTRIFRANFMTFIFRYLNAYICYKCILRDQFGKRLEVKPVTLERICRKLPENTRCNDFEKESRLKWYKRMFLPALSCGTEAWNATRREGNNAWVAAAKFIGHVASSLEAECKYKRTGIILL
jgi:hypothetical protein